MILFYSHVFIKWRQNLAKKYRDKVEFISAFALQFSSDLDIIYETYVQVTWCNVHLAYVGIFVVNGFEKLEQEIRISYENKFHICSEMFDQFWRHLIRYDYKSKSFNGENDVMLWGRYFISWLSHM